MTELVSPAAEPSYIQRLGLSGLPFKGVDEVSFFVSKSVRHNSLLATHLLRTTRMPVVLSGETGIGKSACLDYIQRQAQEDLRFCPLDAQSTLDDHAPLYEALGLKLDSSDTLEDNERYLQQRLSQLRELNQVPVLVVDDLDLCSKDMAQQIEIWLSWQDAQGQPLLQLLATATHLPSWLPADAQTLSLSGLLEQEVELYLNYRLSAASYHGEILFSQKQVSKLYRQSQGHPGKLNQLAHQVLLNMKSHPSALWLTFFIQKYRQIVPLLLLLLLVIIVLTYQQQINAWFTLESKDQEITSEIVLPMPTDDIVPVVVDKKSNTKAIAELEALLESMPAHQGETGLEEAESLDKSIEPVIATESMPVEDLVQVHDAEWIMSQATTHYTFQLIGSWDEQEVVEFIQVHGLEGNVARFVSTRQGQPWYVLIYGLYPNKDEALKASETWSEDLAALPTWLRRMDSVQKQIKAQTVLSE